MLIERTEVQKMAKTGAAFLFCFLAGFVVSHFWTFSRWHNPQSHFWNCIVNDIWFYPQLVLPPGFEMHSPRGSIEVVSPPMAMLLSLVFWMTIGSAFAWVARRLQLRFSFPLAAVVIFVFAMTAHVVLQLFGITAELSGP